MIKVMDKTFAVLEAIVIASPYHPKRVAELAAETGINTATCSRILKELAGAGYIVQVSRQSGYTAGPRAWVFGTMVSYKSALLNRMKPVIDRTAETFHASVIFCERRNFERYILYHRNSCRSLNIRLLQMSFRDLFLTATGLVLLAYSEESLQKEACETVLERSSDLYPATVNFPAFFRKIRKEGGFVCDQCHNEQGVMAFPVFRNEEFLGVIGASIEYEHFRAGAERNAFVTGVRNAASEITNLISYTEVIG